MKCTIPEKNLFVQAKQATDRVSEELKAKRQQKKE
jgi:hypothetical protein